MLVKKEAIRKLVDHFYQVANFLIEDQLQAMQLIIDVATGISQSDRDAILKVDNEYYERQFLMKLISLASLRCEHLKKGSSHKLNQRVSVYLYEIKGESIDSIAHALNISSQQVMAFLEIPLINKRQVPESENGRAIN